MLNNFRLNKITFIIILLAIKMGLFTFFILFYYVNIDSIDLEESNFLFKNWNNFPILDIKLSKDDECQSGYVKLNIGKLEKTNEGYFCHYLNKYSIEKDASKYNKAICSIIDSIEQKIINKWRTYNICAKLLNKNYFNLTIIKEDDVCPEGLKRCGIIDTYGNILCNDKCPINFIKILNRNNSEFNNYTHEDENQFIIQHFENFNKYLITSTNFPIGNVISDLSVKYGRPCIIFHEISYSKYFSYILDPNYEYFNQCEQSIRNINFNPYYYEIDELSKWELYSEENIYEKYFKLPNYPVNSFNKTKYYLYESIYYGINISCKGGKIEFERFMEIKNISEINKEIIFLFLILKFLSIYIYYMLSELIGFKKDDKEIKLYDSIPFFLWWNNFISIAVFISYEIIKLKSNIKIQILDFNDYLKVRSGFTDCFDIVTKSLFTYYLNKFLRIQNYLSICLGINIMESVINIVLGLMIFFKIIYLH
jgi:hypothetical protein